MRKDAIRNEPALPYGRVRGHRSEGEWPSRAWRPVTGWRYNKILYEWGTIVGKLLLREGRQYGVGGMYIEFADVASPGDPVAPPSYGREASAGVEYYNGLATDLTLDYLRVPLVTGTLYSSDAVKFPKGNQPTFFAMTGGAAGVHGKAFSAGSNSVVIGAALVAMPDDGDATQDLVLSRFYFNEGDQPAKLDTGQVGIEWELTLR